MKILHIIGSLDETAGGPSRSVPQTCLELAKLGMDIEIICRPSAKPVTIPQMDKLQVRFLSLTALRSYLDKLDQQEVALLHLQHVWDPYIHVAAKAARKKGIPYLITPRGMLEPWIVNRNRWKKKLAMALYQKQDIREASWLHATCEMEKNNIQALGFTNHISIVPNGLNLAEVPASRAEFGNRKVVFLSRVHPKKGIELLLEAWKQLQPKGWTLDLAGDGDVEYISELEQKIKNEHITGVRYVGAHYGEAKWAFLKTGDIFVLPTFSENFGIAIAEALAVGVPVITTTGTPWQELESHRCGWWINLSVEELAATLEKAMHTAPEELYEMGQRGKALVRGSYDVKAVARQIASIYHELSKA